MAAGSWPSASDAGDEPSLMASRLPGGACDPFAKTFSGRHVCVSEVRNRLLPAGRWIPAHGTCTGSGPGAPRREKPFWQWASSPPGAAEGAARASRSCRRFPDHALHRAFAKGEAVADLLGRRFRGKPVFRSAHMPDRVVLTATGESYSQTFYEGSACSRSRA